MRINLLFTLLLAACSTGSVDIDDTCCSDTEVPQDTGNPSDTDTTCCDDTGTPDTGTPTDTDTSDDTGTTDTGIVVGDPEDDDDGDGYSEEEGDCDDSDLWINPSVIDFLGDGIDQNCDGTDGTDYDGDGVANTASGGDDCDDTDPTISPTTPEIWYDGIDQDCGGDNDYDQDADGHDSADYGGDDCDDLEDGVYPGVVETVDGVDEDCGGDYDNIEVAVFYDGDTDDAWAITVTPWGSTDMLHVYTTVLESYTLVDDYGGYSRVRLTPANSSMYLGTDLDPETVTFSVENTMEGICYAWGPDSATQFPSCIFFDLTL